MEWGYLTREGHLVVADSLGRRFFFKAYRIDTAGSFIEFLGNRRPMERVGNVTVEVALHRTGWTGPPERILRPSVAQLYRTRTRHYAIGPNSRSFRKSSWNRDPIVLPPWFSSGKVPQKQTRPGTSSAFFVSFHDGAIKGCRRDGLTVELFAVELKEFTDFVLGKVTVTLRFETIPEAEAFARQYVTVPDPAAIESVVRVEIDRSRSVSLFKPAPQAADKKASKRNGRRFLLAALLMNLEIVLIIALSLPPFTVILLAVPLIVATVTSLRERQARDTPERQDLSAKWPARVWDRWAAHVPAHAAATASLLKEIGIELDQTAVDLDPLDAFLRKLPPETRFGSAVLGFGALVSQAFLANLGRRVPSEWSYNSQDRMYVLEIRDAYWVSPLNWVARVWDQKPAETIQSLIDLWTGKVCTALAFQHRVGFSALGFTPPDGRLPEALIARVSADAERLAPESFVLADAHFRRRRASYGPFTIDLVETEGVDRRGPRYLPVLAIPFLSDAQEVTGRLDGSSPRSPRQEDVAIVRLSDLPLVPLGVEVRNFLEVGPTFSSRDGELTLHLNAVADKVEIVTPRMREQRPEIKDYLVPMDPREDGVPLSPYARFIGRIEESRETTNPFSKVALWKIRLNISGISLDVLVRKDQCPGLPEAGSFLSGNAWLVADVERPEVSRPGYIR